MNKQFPCKCGHELHVHYLREDKTRKACWYCAIKGEWCEEFVGDNLKYLETKI